VDESRASRAWEAINLHARAEGTAPRIRHACQACVQALEAAGAGVSMIRGSELREPVYATDPRSEELDELQFTLGQGPSVDASAGNGPILVADLSQHDSRARWPMFAPAAVERGISGMFAFPIGLGAARVGVLAVFRQPTGQLSSEEALDALVYADAVLALVLDQRGGVQPDLPYSDDEGFIERRAEVHQAAGMMSVQLGVDVSDALARLRAFAFLSDRRLADVASDVVARRLRFHPDGDAGPPPNTIADREG
jgi:hypothetical protein